MINGIGSIAPISAVPAVEAMVATIAGASASRRTAAERERRLKWLASVRSTLGDAAPLLDAMADEDSLPESLFETRAQIAEALGMVDTMRALMGEGSEASAEGGRGTITAAALARRIAADAPASLRAQARLGAAAVRELIGEIQG